MEVHRPEQAAPRHDHCAGIPTSPGLNMDIGRSDMAPLLDALCITDGPLNDPRVVVRDCCAMPISRASPAPHPRLGQWVLGRKVRRPDDGFFEFVVEKTQDDIIPTTVRDGPHGRILKLLDKIRIEENRHPDGGFYAVTETFADKVVISLPHAWNPTEMKQAFIAYVFWSKQNEFYLDTKLSLAERTRKIRLSKMYASMGVPPVVCKWELRKKKGGYLRKIVKQTIRRKRDGMTMASARLWEDSTNTVTVESSRISSDREWKIGVYDNQDTKINKPSGVAIKEKMASTKARMIKGLVCAKMAGDGKSPLYIVYTSDKSALLVSKHLDSESAADLAAQPLALGEFVKINVKHEKVSSSNIVLDYRVESFTRMTPPSDFSATVSDKGNFALLKMPLVLSNGKLLSLCRTIVAPVSEEVYKKLVNGEKYTATVHFQYDGKSQGITPVVSLNLCEENSIGSKNVSCMQSQSEVFALGEERKSVSPTLGGTGTSSEATCSHGSDEKDKATTRKKKKKVFTVENPYKARIFVGAAIPEHDNLDRFVDMHRPHGLPPFGFCGTYSDDEYSSEGMEEDSAPPNKDDSMDMETEVERDARNQDSSWKMDQRDVSPDMDRMQSYVEPVLQREEMNQESWHRDGRDFFPNTHHAENRPQRVDLQREASARNRVSWEIDQIYDQDEPDQTYARRPVVSREMKEQSLRRRPMQTHPQPRLEEAQRVQREVSRQAGVSSEPERFRHPHLTHNERFVADRARLANHRPPSGPSTSNAWTEPTVHTATLNARTQPLTSTSRTEPLTASRIVSRLASNPALMQAIQSRQPAQYDRIRSFGSSSNNKRRSGFY